MERDLFLKKFRLFVVREHTDILRKIAAIGDLSTSIDCFLKYREESGGEYKNACFQRFVLTGLSKSNQELFLPRISSKKWVLIRRLPYTRIFTFASNKVSSTTFWTLSRFLCKKKRTMINIRTPISWMGTWKAWNQTEYHLFLGNCKFVCLHPSNWTTPTAIAFWEIKTIGNFRQKVVEGHFFTHEAVRISFFNSWINIYSKLYISSPLADLLAWKTTAFHRLFIHIYYFLGSCSYDIEFEVGEIFHGSAWQIYLIIKMKKQEFCYWEWKQIGGRAFAEHSPIDSCILCRWNGLICVHFIPPHPRFKFKYFRNDFDYSLSIWHFSFAFTCADGFHAGRRHTVTNFVESRIPL